MRHRPGHHYQDHGQDCQHDHDGPQAPGGPGGRVWAQAATALRGALGGRHHRSPRVTTVVAITLSAPLAAVVREHRPRPLRNRYELHGRIGLPRDPAVTKNDLTRRPQLGAAAAKCEHVVVDEA